MKTLRYKVVIHDNIKRSLKNFKKQIHDILTDKRSWKVKFIQDDINYDFQIILSPATKIGRICKFKGLSCTDMLTNIIYINNYRWTKGSKASKLSLKDYRIYLINHEVGHVLGFGHLEPIKGKKVPVMNQQTLGLKGGLPWMWPTKKEHRMLKNMI